MNMNRRNVLGLPAGAIAMAGLRGGPAAASADDVMAAIKGFAGGAEPESGMLTLKAPEIAENGNTVPI